MNKQLFIGGVIGAVAATAVGGLAGYRFLDSGEYAEVVAVDPYMKSVTTPRQECREHVVSRKKPVKDPHQVTGTIAGAVIGGVLGNQIGGGSGRDIATATGAVAGGYAGNKIQEKVQDGNTEQQLEHVCRTVYDTSEVQDGYEVTYRIDDQERVVHMAEDPGRRIALDNGEPVLESSG